MCSHCSKSFASSRALKIHEVKQHENAARHVLKCGTCHEEFEHANLLHIHMRVHHNVKVRCPRCKDIFEHPNVLKLHIKAHHSEPVCVACGLKFDHDKLLRLHMEHYHKVGSKGAKQGATTPRQQTGGKVKTEDVQLEMKSVPEEVERIDTENHGEKHQSTQGYEQANGVVLGDWELSHDYDDEAMSHGSSDSREDGSTEGDASVMETEEEGDPQLRETDSRVARQDSELENNRYLPAKLKNEAERSVSPKSENGSDAATVKVMDGRLPTPPLEHHQAPTRVQRSSVIVTASRASPPITIPFASLKQKAVDSEETPQESVTSCLILPANLPDLDGSLEGSPQSPAGSYSSALSGDESGDSETASRKARATKRATLRCNRCQEEFLSKMEYLHHLISHQKGDDDKMITELSPDNQAIEKLKSSLLIKMEARRRDSIPDEINHRFGNVRSDGASPDDQTLSEASRTNPTCEEDRTHDLAAPCTVCNERFPDSEELRAHMENRHKKPHCTECGLFFEHKNLLKIHMNSYHSSLDVLQCYYCGKSFDNRAEFVSHVTSHETTLKDPKEMRRKPNSLRRVPSGTSAEENPSQSQSEKERSPETDSLRNNDVLDDKYEAKKQDDAPTVEYADPVKSRIDDLRQYVERRFPTFGAFRHHKKECSPTPQEPDDWYNEGKTNYLVGPEAKTRIFLPKRHGTFEREGNFTDQRRTSDELESFSPATKVNRDSVERIPSSDVLRRRFSAFSALEITGRSNEHAKSVLLGLSRSKRDGMPLGGPPPLIPVVHPRMSPNFTRHPGVALRNGHQPLSRTASANSALRYHRRPFSTMASKWQESFERVVPPSPVQDSPPDHQEFAARENINNITKEALLHSLSLKRRASAPELGALVRRPHDVPQRLETPAIKTLLEKRPQRFENTEPLPTTSPGRSRQLKEAYQPRRRHPRDFFCHLCGIYFGHKKLLKIHLDCYHGSAQELQCLRCEKNFSSRSEFLEHLMSHEGGDELLAMQRKRLKLTARNSVPLTSEGETVIRRELNISVAAQDTAVGKETTRRGDIESADILGEFRHPLPEELGHRVVEEHHERPAQQDKSNNDLKDERRVTSGKASSVKTEDDEGANFCFVCGQSFSNGKKLEHHISSHAVVDKDGRYCCSLCHKTFDHHRKLEIHTRSHTGFKPHKCELCGRCFPYYSSYYYHKMTHTEDRPHKCGVCGKGFIQTRYLRSHMKTHKDQNGWTSDEELNDESTEQMETSEDVAATTSPISETETKVKTEQMNQSDCSPQRDLEEHDTARILCSFKQGSGVGFCRQSSPKHIESEVEMRSDVVSKAFSGSEDSPSTDRSRDPNSPPSMNGTPERNSSVEATEDDENGDTDCSKNTGTLTKVNKETPQDSADERLPKTKRKKYQCKHCHKNFSSYSSLHVHVRIHTGQRPYSCSHCFKKFTHSSGLKRHVRCHTGEKPYPCPACPAAFADRGALKSHIRTHTGERPFVCDLCNKTFTQPSSLRVHKKTVHVHEFFDEK